jgi:hypothetical protein
MVEEKVLLVKVDNLEDVADSLTNSVSTEKFSWCRESMGISTLDCLSRNPMTPVCKENNKWKNVGYVLYSLHNCRPPISGFKGGAREKKNGGLFTKFLGGISPLAWVVFLL